MTDMSGGASLLPCTPGVVTSSDHDDDEREHHALRPFATLTSHEISRPRMVYGGTFVEKLPLMTDHPDMTTEYPDDDDDNNDNNNDDNNDDNNDNNNNDNDNDNNNDNEIHVLIKRNLLALHQSSARCTGKQENGI